MNFWFEHCVTIICFFPGLALALPCARSRRRSWRACIRASPMFLCFNMPMQGWHFNFLASLYHLSTAGAGWLQFDLKVDVVDGFFYNCCSWCCCDWWLFLFCFWSLLLLLLMLLWVVEACCNLFLLFEVIGCKVTCRWNCVSACCSGDPASWSASTLTPSWRMRCVSVAVKRKAFCSLARKSAIRIIC